MNLLNTILKVKNTVSGFGCKMEEKKCIKIVRTKTLTSIISPNWIESKKEEDMSPFIFVHTDTVLDLFWIRVVIYRIQTRHKAGSGTDLMKYST